MNEIQLGRNKVLEMITVPRNRQVLIASEIVMFMQQFCGVNVIAYYSSQIFLDGGFSPISALSASLGFGLVNWLFAIPAIYTIDTFGRRNLLLTTFPLMSIFMFFTGFGFYIPADTMHTARISCIALGIYLFGICYSPGEGPVPFTYSAEAYPLYVRAYAAFTTPGGFAWYATWNIIGFFLVLLFMPETMGKTLEELDQVFSVPTHVHMAYGLRQVPYFLKRYLLRQHVEPERLYEHEDVSDKDAGYDYDAEKSTG